MRMSSAKFRKSWLAMVSIVVLSATLSARALPSLTASFSNLVPTVGVQGNSDTALLAVRKQDRIARNAKGEMTRLSPEEHLRRAAIYLANRAFDEARAHWQALINFYPSDPRVASALLGMGRSYFQGRRYAEAYAAYDRLAREYPTTKDGREGLNFSAASLLRLGRTSEAADRYIQYINRFPDGERIDTAHLNAIDTLREAGRTQEALSWVTRTRQRFAGTPTAANALFGQLRLEISEGTWSKAIATAEELSRESFQKGVATSPSEVAYLKAYSLERAGRQAEAYRAYMAVPGGMDSYYGWLATDHLASVADGRSRGFAGDRIEIVKAQIDQVADRYPIPYRLIIINEATKRKLDPRFVLALIKQESVFRPQAKSPAGARGLLQLTIDAAQKYAAHAGMKSVEENQLYEPETSIRLGSEYLAELAAMFPNLPEAVAASYNGGEDNVARWVRRAKQKDAGVFTSEVGFDETKAYVQKVMNNYRVYQQLYTADLKRK
jgi:soluble lytic murein transglycosylase